MKYLIFSAVCAIISLAAVSCNQTTEEMTEADLREAEMAIAQGDMRAAESVTNHVIGSKPLENFTPRQLGRLSLIYMQLADSTDQGDHVSQATECYRKAYEANADSANAFYSNVPPEHTARAVLLSAIVHSTDIPTDSLHFDD